MCTWHIYLKQANNWLSLHAVKFYSVFPAVPLPQSQPFAPRVVFFSLAQIYARSWYKNKTSRPSSAIVGADNLQAKGQVEGGEQTGGENRALAGADLLLGEALEQVVAQMAHAVDEVKDKGEAEAELDEALGGKGQGGEAGDEALRLDVEAGEGGDEVGEEVGVGGAGEGTAGDTGPGRGGEPRLRALVDAKMGGDGALAALGGEDVGALVGGQAGGLDGTAAGHMVSQCRLEGPVVIGLGGCRRLHCRVGGHLTEPGWWKCAQPWPDGACSG